MQWQGVSDFKIETVPTHQWLNISVQGDDIAIRIGDLADSSMMAKTLIIFVHRLQ